MFCLEAPFDKSNVDPNNTQEKTSTPLEDPLTPAVTGIVSALFTKLKRHNQPFTGQDLLNKIKSFHECADLIHKANQVCQRCHVQPLEIRIEHIPSGNAAEQEDNVLKVEASLSTREKLCAAIFEIINLTKNEQFQKIEETSYKSADEFAEAIENVVYESALLFNKIITKINTSRRKNHKSLICNPYQGINYISFKEYYSIHLPEEHKDYHRNFWTKRQLERSQVAANKQMELQQAIGTFKL